MVDVPTRLEHDDLANDLASLDSTLSARITALEDRGTSTTPGIFHVQDYGASGRLDRDDAPAINRAVMAATAYGNGVVQLGPAHGMASDVVINRGITIRGLGARQTVITPLADNWCFTVNSAERAGEWQAADTAYRPLADRSGLELRDFTINGLDRAKGGNGIRINRADDLLIDNVTFGFLGGTALQIGAADGSNGTGGVRESDFNRVKVYKCGGPGVPSVIIQNNPTNTGDGTNQLYFDQFRLVYNHGGMVIRNHHATETLRRIIIANAQIHGLSHGGSIGNETDHDLITIEGGVTSVTLDNSMVNGSAANLAVVRTKSSPTTRRAPAGLIVTNMTAGECSGDVVVIDRLTDLTMTARVNTGSIGGAVLRVADGATVIHDVRLTGTSAPKVVMPLATKDRGTVTFAGRPLA